MKEIDKPGSGHFHFRSYPLEPDARVKHDLRFLVRFLLNSQALDGMAIKAVRIFAFDRDLIIQMLFFIMHGPGVAEIAGLAEAVGFCQIADVLVINRLAVWTRRNSNVAYPAVVVESDNDILVAAVLVENPNLLAFIFRFEVEPRMGLSVGHVELNPQNFWGGLLGCGPQVGRGQDKDQQKVFQIHSPRTCTSLSVCGIDWSLESCVETQPPEAALHVFLFLIIGSPSFENDPL